jgi:hypothetical protein
LPRSYKNLRNQELLRREVCPLILEADGTELLKLISWRNSTTAHQICGALDAFSSSFSSVFRIAKIQANKLKRKTGFYSLGSHASLYHLAIRVTPT